MYERTAGIPGPKDSTHEQPYQAPPPQGYPQPTPPPGAGYPGQPSVQGVPLQQQIPVQAPYKVAYVEGAPPPAAPPGYMYVLKNDFSIAGIILAIVFFPIGLLCMLCMMEKYWQLMPLGAYTSAYGIAGV
ncbi:hypothetical protein BSKO_04728 [Bryopsis sp. KO-2023]|nr:hypothetical protein BSKO_04728 [Bryopsis sp. KO-2023]